MKALVIYDSAYGNTAQVAKTLAERLKAKARLVGDVTPKDVEEVDLVVVGSPTQGGRPTQAVQAYLRNLLPGALKGKSVAAFDTRFALKEHGIGLRLLMQTIGFAAPRIARDLQAKGGVLADQPEWFIVEEKEGPLKHGELDRAAHWAEKLYQPITQRLFSFGKEANFHLPCKWKF